MNTTDLKPGTVVHFFDRETTPPKNKFSVVVGISEDHFHIATVYINSEVNQKHISSSELKSLQYEVDHTKYPRFLRWNSFIDCSNIKHRMKSSFLTNMNDGGQIVGYLTREDLEKVLNLIKGASTISPYYLRLYGLI